VGGGAVYLDQNQVFAQWVFHRNALPDEIGERFALFVRPLVETYRSLGIPASYRPINDIHVEGRKIGGTGAAQMGEAEVVVGSLMFDFDFATMARVLKVPSEKMRDKVYQSLSEYMTTMARCLGSVPDRDHLVGIYVRHCAQALGRDIAPGRLTDKELALAAELDRRFASDAWLNQKGGLRQSGVRIHEDVRVVEVAHKASGGLIRVTARLAAGRIDDVSLSGDFTMLPASVLGALEEGLRGAPLERDAMQARVANIYTSAGIQSPGVSPDDLVTAVLQVLPADAR
jgi:lipoate-protein ligase A